MTDVALEGVTEQQLQQSESELLARVPESGEPIGNTKLKKQLGWDDARYWLIRDRLLDRGILEVGRGRGGSVRRVKATTIVAPAVPIATQQERPARIRGHLRPKRRWKREWDFLAYVVIAFAYVAAAMLYGAYQARTGASAELPLKWLGFAGLTAITFGYAIQTGLQTKAGPTFWLLLAGVFVVRTAIWVLVLARVEEVSLLVYAVASGPEYVLVLSVVGAFLKPEQ